MKRFLNLGSGGHPMPGWINLDLYNSDTPPDVVGSVFSLPVKTGSIERVYIGHLLEHLGLFEQRPFWDEVFRVGLHGAAVMVVGPDVAAFNRYFQKRHPCAPGWLLDPIVSERKPEDKPGIWHRWVPTEALTAEVMRQYGVQKVEPQDVRTVSRPLWPNTDTSPWQCAVSGRVP